MHLCPHYSYAPNIQRIFSLYFRTGDSPLTHNNDKVIFILGTDKKSTQKRDCRVQTAGEQNWTPANYIWSPPLCFTEPCTHLSHCVSKFVAQFLVIRLHSQLALTTSVKWVVTLMSLFNENQWREYKPSYCCQLDFVDVPGKVEIGNKLASEMRLFWNHWCA